MDEFERRAWALAYVRQVEDVLGCGFESQEIGKVIDLFLEAFREGREDVKANVRAALRGVL